MEVNNNCEMSHSVYIIKLSMEMASIRPMNLPKVVNDAKYCEYTPEI